MGDNINFSQQLRKAKIMIDSGFVILIDSWFWLILDSDWFWIRVNRSQHKKMSFFKKKWKYLIFDYLAGFCFAMWNFIDSILKCWKGLVVSDKWEYRIGDYWPITGLEWTCHLPLYNLRTWIHKKLINCCLNLLQKVLLGKGKFSSK